MLIIRLTIIRQEFLEILMISESPARWLGVPPLGGLSQFKRRVNAGLQTLRKARCNAVQTLLPLHLSFCLTTLKNEASGNDANGSVFFALRTVTSDPRSTRIGLRPSSVRYTG